METWCELFMRCDQIEDFPRQSALRCFPVCYSTICAEYIRTSFHFGPCQITFSVFAENSYLPFKLSARSNGLIEKSDKLFFFFLFLVFVALQKLGDGVTTCAALSGEGVFFCFLPVQAVTAA